MKAKEYKYPNVVSFFLILSPLIYNIINAILFSVNPNIGINTNAKITSIAILSGRVTSNYMYFFGILCASFMVLFGNRNKYLYPMGVTAALVTTASTFFNMIFEGIIFNRPLYIILSLLRITACIIMFISIVFALHKNKHAKKIAIITSICYMVLIIQCAIIRTQFNIPGVTGYSMINRILSFLQVLMYINIPIAVYILVGHALATGQINNGNLTLENK